METNFKKFIQDSLLEEAAAIEKEVLSDPASAYIHTTPEMKDELFRKINIIKKSSNS